MYFRVVQQSRDALAFQVVLEGERVGLTSVEFRDQAAVQRAIEAVIASLREGVDASLQVEGDSYHFTLRGEDGELLARGIACSSPAEADAGLAEMQRWAATVERFRVVNLARPQKSGAKPVDTIQVAVRYDLEPCTRAKKPGLELLNRASDGLFTAHLHGERGEVLLYLRGFTTRFARDEQVESVFVAAADPRRYDRREAEGRRYFVLTARNGREIARSPWLASEAECDAAIAQLVRLAPIEAKEYGAARTRRKVAESGYDLTRRSTSGAAGFEAFKAEDGHHYFHFNDERGEALLFSHGYSTPKARDHGIRSLLKGAGDPVCYRVAADELRFAISAVNGRELARSRLFGSRAALDRAIAWIRSEIIPLGRKYGIRLWESSFIELPHELGGGDDGAHSQDPDELARQALDASRDASLARLAPPSAPPRPTSAPPSPAAPRDVSLHSARAASSAPSDASPPSPRPTSAPPSPVPDPAAPRGASLHSPSSASRDASPVSRAASPRSPESAITSPHASRTSPAAGDASSQSPSSPSRDVSPHSPPAASRDDSPQSPRSAARDEVIRDDSPHSSDAAGSAPSSAQLLSASRDASSHSSDFTARDAADHSGPASTSISGARDPAPSPDPSRALFVEGERNSPAASPSPAGTDALELDALELPDLQLFDPSPRRGESPVPVADAPEPPSGPFSARELDDALAPLTALEFDDDAPIAVDPDDSATFAAASVHALPHVPLPEEDSLTLALDSTDLSTFATAFPHPPPRPLDPLDSHDPDSSSPSEPVPAPRSTDSLVARATPGVEPSPHLVRTPAASRPIATFPPPFTPTPIDPPDLAASDGTEDSLAIELDPSEVSTFDLADPARAASILGDREQEPVPPLAVVDAAPFTAEGHASGSGHASAEPSLDPPEAHAPREPEATELSSRREDSLTLALDALEAPLAAEPPTAAIPSTDLRSALPGPQDNPPAGETGEDSLTRSLEALDVPEPVALPTGDRDDAPPLAFRAPPSVAREAPGTPVPSIEGASSGPGAAVEDRTKTPALAPFVDAPLAASARIPPPSPAREDSLTRALDALDVPPDAEPFTSDDDDSSTRAVGADDARPQQLDGGDPLPADRQDPQSRALDALAVDTDDVPSDSRPPQADTSPDPQDSLARALDALAVDASPATDDDDAPSDSRPPQADTSPDPQDSLTRALDALAVDVSPATDDDDAPSDSRPHRADLAPLGGDTSPDPQDSLTRVLGALEIDAVDDLEKVRPTAQASPVRADDGLPTEDEAALAAGAAPEPTRADPPAGSPSRGASTALPFSAVPPTYAHEDLAPKPGDSLTSLASLGPQDSGGDHPTSPSLDPADSLAAIAALHSRHLPSPARDPADSLADLQSSALSPQKDPADSLSDPNPRNLSDSPLDPADSLAAIVRLEADVSGVDSHLHARSDLGQADEDSPLDPADSLAAIVRLEVDVSGVDSHLHAHSDLGQADEDSPLDPADSLAAIARLEVDVSGVDSHLHARPDLSHADEASPLDPADSLAAIARLESDLTAPQSHASPGLGDAHQASPLDPADSLAAIARLEADLAAPQSHASPGLGEAHQASPLDPADSLAAIARLESDVSGGHPRPHARPDLGQAHEGSPLDPADSLTAPGVLDPRRSGSASSTRRIDPAESLTAFAVLDPQDSGTGVLDSPAARLTRAARASDPSPAESLTSLAVLEPDDDDAPTPSPPPPTAARGHSPLLLTDSDGSDESSEIAEFDVEPAGPPEPVAESTLAAPQPDQSIVSDSAHSSTDPPLLVEPPMLPALEDAAPLYRLSAPPQPVSDGPLILSNPVDDPAAAATAPHGDRAVVDNSPREPTARPESRPSVRPQPRPPSAESPRAPSRPHAASPALASPPRPSSESSRPHAAPPPRPSSESSRPHAASLAPHSPPGSARESSRPHAISPAPHSPPGSARESSRPHATSPDPHSPPGSARESSRPHAISLAPHSPPGSARESSRPHAISPDPHSPPGSARESSRPHVSLDSPRSPSLATPPDPSSTRESSRPHASPSLPSSTRESSRPHASSSLDSPLSPSLHSSTRESSRPHAESLDSPPPSLATASDHSSTREPSRPHAESLDSPPSPSLATAPDHSSTRESSRPHAESLESPRSPSLAAASDHSSTRESSRPHAESPSPHSSTRESSHTASLDSPRSPALATAPSSTREPSRPHASLGSPSPAASPLAGESPSFTDESPLAPTDLGSDDSPRSRSLSDAPSLSELAAAHVGQPAAWIPPHLPVMAKPGPAGPIPPITNPYPRPFIPPGTLAAIGLANRPGAAAAAGSSPAPSAPTPVAAPPSPPPVEPGEATARPDLGLLGPPEPADLPRAEAPALVPELAVLLRDTTIPSPRRREGSAPLFAARREPSSTHAVPTLLARREPSSAQSAPALVPALDALEFESPGGPRPRRSLPNLIPEPGAPVTVNLDRPLVERPPVEPPRRSLPNLLPEPGAPVSPLDRTLLAEAERREPPAGEPPVSKDISSSSPGTPQPGALHDLPTLVPVGLAVTQPAPVKPAPAPVLPTDVPVPLPRLPPIRVVPGVRDRWLWVGVVLAALAFLGAVASRLHRGGEPASEVAERVDPPPSADQPPAEPPPEATPEPAPAEPPREPAPPAVIPPGPPPLAGAAIVCPETADPAIGLLVAPFTPLAGEPLRVFAATLEGDVALGLHVLAGDGPAAGALDARVHLGTPSSAVAGFTPAAVGEYTFAVVRDGAAVTCSKVQVLGEPPQRPPFAAKGRAWAVERAWSAAEEALYSAWVRELFSAPPGDPLSFARLDVATGDPARNLLHDALGLREDRLDDPVALRLRPDGADLPYVVRAYWSWKRRLPFAYRKCKRGGDGKAPRCGDARTNLAPGPGFTMPATELARVQRFVHRNIGWGVHAGNARTAIGDSASDLYPVRLDHRGLRPGAVYADPYDHVFFVVDLVPARDGRPGALLAVDGEPDGGIVRREFWEGEFLWSTEPAHGGVGFKQFRPVVRQPGGGLVQLGDAAIAGAPDLGDIWTGHAELAGTAFYDAVLALFEPPPWDASRLQREAVAAFAELARSRVEPIARAAEFARDRKRAIAMPKGWQVFEATGAWETHSTPARDLRLLLALDVVLGLPDRVRERPNLYVTDGDPEARARALAEELDVLLRDPQYAITYTRSDGSPWTLSLRDLADREEALARAYNPNDCPELRWGAPEGSDELATCSFRAPAEQRARMEAYRGWLQQRRLPTRGDKSP